MSLNIVECQRAGVSGKLLSGQDDKSNATLGCRKPLDHLNLTCGCGRHTRTKCYEDPLIWTITICIMDKLS